MFYVVVKVIQNTCYTSICGPETVTHLLFRCDKLNGLGNILWENVLHQLHLNQLSNVVFKYITRKTHKILTKFCMHNTYVPEWKTVYRAILIYIYRLYKDKCK